MCVCVRVSWFLCISVARVYVWRLDCLSVSWVCVWRIVPRCNAEWQEVGCVWRRQFTGGPVWRPPLPFQIPLTWQKLLPSPSSTLLLLPPPFTLSYLLLNIHSRDSETWKQSYCAPPLLTVKYIPQISLLLPSSKQRCSCFLSPLYPSLPCPFVVCMYSSHVLIAAWKVLTVSQSTVTGETWTTDRLPQPCPIFVPSFVHVCVCVLYVYSIIFREVMHKEQI